MILVMISDYAYLHKFVPPIRSTVIFSNNRTNTISQECNSFMDNLITKFLSPTSWTWIMNVTAHSSSIWKGNNNNNSFDSPYFSGESEIFHQTEVSPTSKASFPEIEIDSEFQSSSPHPMMGDGGLDDEDHVDQIGRFPQLHLQCIHLKLLRCWQ